MAELITIQGTVTNAGTHNPLAGVKVIARQDGTEIHQDTGQDGKYAVQMAAGVWQISVQAPGYNPPEAYKHNFSAGTAGIDFALQEGYTLAGWVITQQEGKPASGVIVEARAAIADKTIVHQVLSNAEGKYRFTGLPAGQWQVQGARGDAQTERVTRDVGPDASSLNLVLARQMTPVDWNWGMGFFSALGVLLLALIVVYFLVHSRYAPQPEPELLTFKGQVAQMTGALAQVNKPADGGKVSLQPLRSSFTLLKENWDGAARVVTSIAPGQKDQVSHLIAGVEAALAADDALGMEASLVALRALLDNLPALYFWYEAPAIYLEVLMWSLAGILVSLMISSGYYLRRRRFYAEGIWMHVSHLFSAPLIALVMVFLIAQVNLTVQIDTSQVTLNVHNPVLLAAISFAIAVRPWALIEFVREAGSRFASQIRTQISGGPDAKAQKESE